MKNILLFLMLFIAIHAHGQQVSEYRQVISENAVPGIIQATFNKQYPNVTVNNWYVTHVTYWYNDYSSGWYDGWYGTRVIVAHTFTNPNYFEVSFLNEVGERCRAMYNRYGYWYETRSQLRGLPAVVTEGLATTKYADWKKSALKERIESPAWPNSIYRFKVSKGIKSRIIRLDHNGQIIQERLLKDLD